MEYQSRFSSDDLGDEGCSDLDYIVGPQGLPGPQGPIGPQGPAGPAAGGGLQAIVSASGNIPVGQIYSIIDATGAVVVTFPPISEVLVDGVATPYVVYNYSGFLVGIVGSGSDPVQRAPEAFEKFANESVTFLPTSLGWLVI